MLNILAGAWVDNVITLVSAIVVVHGHYFLGNLPQNTSSLQSTLLLIFTSVPYSTIIKWEIFSKSGARISK